MKSRQRMSGIVWPIVAALAAAVPVARACTIPVFRYALVSWDADPYQVVVFHDGGPGEVEKKLIEDLQRLEADEGEPCNLVVLTADIQGELDEPLRQLWASQTSAKPPWMVVGYPQQAKIETPVWAEPLTPANVRALVDSPARREIADRLRAGQASVWVLLESGDRKADDAAARLLDTELKKSAGQLQKMRRDELTRAGIDIEAIKADEVEIAFSLVRISREDTAERFLAAMLLHSEDDLTTFEAPMVFPVFGRGRALYAIVGRGINADNILEAGWFLVGGCTCQVKWGNPGIDLLMKADWDEAAEALPAVEVIPLTGLLTAVTATAPATAPAGGDAVAHPEVTGPAPAAPGDAAPERKSTPLVRNALISVAIGLGVAVSLALVLSVRRRASRS